jgi:conjugation system TraG family ATPase
MKTLNIQQILPFQEIDKHWLISRKGDITVAFELTKPSLFGFSQTETQALHEVLCKAIVSFPTGTVFHFQEWFTGALYESAPSKGDLLSDSSDRHFQGRRHRDHRSYLYITKRVGGQRPPNTALSTLVRPTLVPEFILNPTKVEAFLAECRRLADLLNAGGLVRARLLEGEELAGTVEKTGLIEQYLNLNPHHLSPRYEDVGFSKGDFRVGNKEVVLATLAEAIRLPAQCSPHGRYEPYSTAGTDFPIGFATPLGPLLDLDHVYNLYIVKEAARPLLKNLETQRRRLHSLAGKSRINAATVADIDAYLEQAAKPGNPPVRVHINVMAWSDGVIKGELRSQVATAIARTGAVPHFETVITPVLWWAGIPGNAADLPIDETFYSFPAPALCWFIPESSAPQASAPSGIRLGDRLSGIPVTIDLSDEPLRKGLITNRNKFVLGGSGSGKSFFTNHLVRSYHELGAHIVLLDIGGSYKGLCQLLNGYYFECTATQPISFNPFLLASGETLDTEKKESLIALLQTLWKKTDEGFRRSEYVTLSNMIEGFYAYMGGDSTVSPCFDCFYRWVLERFHLQLEKDGIRETDFDCRNFLYVLRPYTYGGEYAELLNAKENTDLFHQRLIVFDLDSIKDHPILFPVTTLIIMELFISKMRKLKGVRKVILLEEAWKAIAKEGMSDYVKYLFKTVRKFYGEAIVVTQDIEDIISSPVVKNTIINNADCKILLDQSKFINRFDPIMELLGLTEKDKTLVLSLNKANDPNLRYKEVFIALGANHSQVYRVEVSLEEYLTFTTEERERVTVLDYAEKKGGMKKGIPALAADIRSGAVKLLLALLFTAGLLLAPQGRASAQLLDIIDEAIKAALEAADLRLQQLQTQTLWLQNTQKELENSMTGGLLDDITGWVRQQEELYQEYYAELWQVKGAFTTFSRTRAVIDRQVQLVRGLQQATAAVTSDPHFSATELTHILHVYNGILDASIRNVSRLAGVIGSFATQMDDAGRLRIIDETAGDIDRNYTALQAYTQENRLLSLQRAKDQADIQTIRALYGIQ